MKRTLLLASLLAAFALGACGKKEEPPAVVAPAPAQVSPPATPATTPSPSASSALDAANAATEAAKKNSQSPAPKP